MSFHIFYTKITKFWGHGTFFLSKTWKHNFAILLSVFVNMVSINLPTFHFLRMGECSNLYVAQQKTTSNVHTKLNQYVYYSNWFDWNIWARTKFILYSVTNSVWFIELLVRSNINWALVFYFFSNRISLGYPLNLGDDIKESRNIIKSPSCAMPYRSF